MDAIKTRLLETARGHHPQTPRAFDHYAVVKVDRDVVGSAGQTFTKDAYALADPNTYLVGGEGRRAVLSPLGPGHVMLPAEHVKACGVSYNSDKTGGRKA